MRPTLWAAVALTLARCASPAEAAPKTAMTQPAVQERSFNVAE